MSSSPPFDAIVRVNAAYYDEHAEAFVASTADLNMAHVQAGFLEWVPPGGRILDAGCGSGRDSLRFLELGFAVDAFDASERMVREASRRTGLTVRRLTFQELEAAAEYDGIWACASLLHVPRAELPAVLTHLHRALKPGGVLFASFKHGKGEGWRHGRFFSDHDEASLHEAVAKAPGLEVARLGTTTDVRPGRADERWLNALIAHRP